MYQPSAMGSDAIEVTSETWGELFVLLPHITTQKDRKRKTLHRVLQITQQFYSIARSSNHIAKKLPALLVMRT